MEAYKSIPEVEIVAGVDILQERLDVMETKWGLPKKALFKLLFSPHQREELFELLGGMRRTVPFEIFDHPFSPGRSAGNGAFEGKRT